MKTPRLPFPGFKWKWLSLLPTEGLLSPPVYLGVLRVLSMHQGEPPSSDKLRNDLEMVEKETETDVDLARASSGRNLIRNSGQYWIGTGLYKKQKGKIELTPFGKKVSDGRINQDEFAASVINSTVLPNANTEKSAEIKKWNQAGLKIYPFKIILAVLSELQKQSYESYLTPFELIRIIIPLSGEKACTKTMANAIIDFRRKHLDLDGWPNCVPSSNDFRIARQFLLFLAEFGVCRKEPGINRYDEKYFCQSSAAKEISIAKEVQLDAEHPENFISELNKTEIPYLIERQRRQISVYVRAGQASFRDKVLSAFKNKCIITGETFNPVLEAAHIRPVKYKGSDQVGNGLCLRVDIHRLYDSGRIRIGENGTIQKNSFLEHSPSYKNLPQDIVIPSFVSTININWRNRYL
jgi:hypothetical protein